MTDDLIELYPRLRNLPDLETMQREMIDGVWAEIERVLDETNDLT